MNTLSLVEDDTYFYDQEAGDRVVRFFSKYLRHYEGRHVDKPFNLHPEQQRIIRDIYGWKEVSTGLRRFRYVWWEGAVGSGKSPVLAGLGIYHLLLDGEMGGQIYSLGSCYNEAAVVFDCAKRFIEQSPTLAKRLKCYQYKIVDKKTNSVWKIVSGKGPGAGARPSFVAADEIHNWKDRTAYDALAGRLGKRTQPLFVCATNAGENRASLYASLREEAELVLEGKRKNDQLYPVIWCADQNAQIDDEAAWRQANPLLDVTITTQAVRDECERSRHDPALEARFRRLYLGQRQQAATRWLDLDLWDLATKEIDPAAIKDAPLFVGMDLAEVDDLCAVVYLWPTADRLFVDSHFWVPRNTAKRYEQRFSIPYSEWETLGHITLVDEPTISEAVRQQIAATIIERSKQWKIKAIAYDRWHADECVAALEAKGLPCVKTAQGYTLSPSCATLDRRLKEKTITIAPNKVLRFCAENVEVTTDQRGNVYPVKPGRSDKNNHGKRENKVDGITALLTGLVDARKATFAKAQPVKRSAGVWTL